MVAEKKVAFSESWSAMARQAALANQALAGSSSRRFIGQVAVCRRISGPVPSRCCDRPGQGCRAGASQGSCQRQTSWTHKASLIG